MLSLWLTATAACAAGGLPDGWECTGEDEGCVGGEVCRTYDSKPRCLALCSFPWQCESGEGCSEGDLEGLCVPYSAACNSHADCWAGFYCSTNAGQCVKCADNGQDPYCRATNCTENWDCPAELDRESVCSVTSTSTDCQGTRLERRCSDGSCSSVAVDDDSGCLGEEHECPNNFAPIACTGEEDQPVPQCPTTCTPGNGDCLHGFECEAGACVMIAGLGAPCTGSGQGTCESDDLKCESSVCCAAIGPTCCSDAGPCTDGLACDPVLSSCQTACTDYETSACADPAGTYCLGNACVDREANDEPCVHNTACESGVCECFNAACTDRRCRSTFCGLCEVALNGTNCQPGLGDPDAVDDPNPADDCGDTLSCYDGSCAKDNDQSCSSNTECGHVCVEGSCRGASPYGGPCDEDADCESPNQCATDSTCRKPLGASCDAPGECVDGYCADHVCCNSACDGDCRDCSTTPGQCLPNSWEHRDCLECKKCNDGLCVNQSNTEDIKEECLCGLCDGDGSCVVTPGTDCGDCMECDADGNCQSYCIAVGGIDATCNADGDTCEWVRDVLYYFSSPDLYGCETTCLSVGDGTCAGIGTDPDGTNGRYLRWLGTNDCDEYYLGEAGCDDTSGTSPSTSDRCPDGHLGGWRRCRCERTHL